ncbi:MAG TPA: helix-turn-helix domain-containing protein [Gemmatimonadaceae bacterium]|nr:helix-turn-helix domain-containing protein [Gemmatimonadaceae bacterium]
MSPSHSAPSGPPAGPRGRILELLREQPLSAATLAERLGVTHNAVRVHLAALERDRLVEPAAMRKGPSRPTVLYGLTREAEVALSRVYVPFAAHLVDVIAERLPHDTLDPLLREVGRRLAATLPRGRGSLAARVEAASELLRSVGASNDVKSVDGHLTICGHGCVLAEASRSQRAVCSAMEELISELVQAKVRECCERGERPRCRFEIIEDA